MANNSLEGNILIAILGLVSKIGALAVLWRDVGKHNLTTEQVNASIEKIIKDEKATNDAEWAIVNQGSPDHSTR